MSRTYQRAKYRVTVEDDGAIRVQHGDWLSKYSVAIHNDFTRLDEYYRKGADGRLVPVQDVNLIRAGETLYHLPTHRAWRRSRRITMPEEKIVASVPRPPVLSAQQKEQLIKRHMSEDYGLRGENLSVVGGVLNIVGHADSALTVLEIGGLIAEGTAAAAVATGVGLLATLTTPMVIVDALNASEVGQRMMGMRAVAYGITAWAFGDPVPAPSPAILVNLKSSPTYSKREHEAYVAAWSAAVAQASRSMEVQVTKRKVTKQSYQVLLQALGDGTRVGLCKQLLKGFEKELNGAAAHAWKANYSIEYPR